MQNIVMIRNEDCYVGTWDLCKGFDMDHRHLIRLIEKYKCDFDELGESAFKRQKRSGKKGGRMIVEYILNEPQTTYLTTLLQNNSTVRFYKLRLTKMFFSQRKLIAKLIAQRQNEEWNRARIEGKKIRTFETDVIQEFVEYAKNQGSQNAEKYYMAITKMENHTLLLDFVDQKYNNLRNLVSSIGLGHLKEADYIVARALKEGMERKLHYKDCYAMAKERVEIFAEFVGKTPLQDLLDSNKSLLEKYQ